MYKESLVRKHPIILVMMLSGLGAACSLAFLIAYFGNIPLHWIMLSLLVCTCIMAFFDLSRLPLAGLFRFITRLVLSAIVGFVVFSYAVLWVSIVVAIFSLILLSILASAMSNEPGTIGIFCFIVLLYNIIFGLFSINVVIFTPIEYAFSRYEFIFSLSLVISFFSLLLYFLIINMDSVRWFSSSRLRIPQTMKRSSIVLFAVIGVIFIALIFASWIGRFVVALINGIVGLIQSFFSFIESVLQNLFATEELPYTPSDNALPQEVYEYSYEAGANNVVLGILVGVVFFAVAAILLYNIIGFVIKKIKKWLRRRKGEKDKVILVNDVFTEVIEDIIPARKKRSSRNHKAQRKYSSLLTERERIQFIYREYVRRAKRKGLTNDHNSSTPNEVLGEIAENASKKAFPHEEDLAVAYNAVRYSNDDTVKIVKADELKRKLL